MASGVSGPGNGGGRPPIPPKPDLSKTPSSSTDFSGHTIQPGDKEGKAGGTGSASAEVGEQIVHQQAERLGGGASGVSADGRFHIDFNKAKEAVARGVQMITWKKGGGTSSPTQPTSGIRSPSLRALNERIQKQIKDARVNWMLQASKDLSKVGQTSQAPEEALSYTQRAHDMLKKAKDLLTGKGKDTQPSGESTPTPPAETTTPTSPVPAEEATPSPRVITGPAVSFMEPIIEEADEDPITSQTSGEEILEALETGSTSEESLEEIDESLNNLRDRIAHLQLRLTEADGEEGVSQSFWGRTREQLQNCLTLIQSAIQNLAARIRRGGRAAAECLRRCCACKGGAQDDPLNDDVVVDFSRGSFAFADEQEHNQQRLEAAFAKYMRNHGDDFVKKYEGGSRLRLPRAVANAFIEEQQGAGGPQSPAPSPRVQALLQRFDDVRRDLGALPQQGSVSESDLQSALEQMGNTLTSLEGVFGIGPDKRRRRSI